MPKKKRRRKWIHQSTWKYTIINAKETNGVGSEYIRTQPRTFLVRQLKSSLAGECKTFLGEAAVLIMRLFGTASVFCSYVRWWEQRRYVKVAGRNKGVRQARTGNRLCRRREVALTPTHSDRRTQTIVTNRLINFTYHGSDLGNFYHFRLCHTTISLFARTYIL